MHNLNQHEPPGHGKDAPRARHGSAGFEARGLIRNNSQLSLEPSHVKLPSRRSAIRLRCLDCSAGSRIEVEQCRHLKCPLHIFRSGQGKQDPRDRDRAIKAFCLECNNTRAEVILCTAKACSLHPYRKATLDHPTGRPIVCEKTPPAGNIQTSNG